MAGTGSMVPENQAEESTGQHSVKPDAALRYWYINGSGVLTGIIIRDSKKRFEDGTKVFTTELKEVTPEGYIKTKNTVYQLLEPEQYYNRMLDNRALEKLQEAVRAGKVDFLPVRRID